MLLDTHKADIDAILARYANPRSAVLPLLYIAQDTYGHLTHDAINEVAALLNMPPTDVFEVVGFYTLFYDRPVGRWVLQVCDDVPCCYLGAEELIGSLKQKLGVREDQMTPDGMFTIQRVKCLAACDKAPLLQANLDYVYNVTPDKVDALLTSLRERAAKGESLSVSGRLSEDYTFDANGKLVWLERTMGVATVASEPAASEITTDAPAASEPAASEPSDDTPAETASEPAHDAS